MCLRGPGEEPSLSPALLSMVSLSLWAGRSLTVRAAVAVDTAGSVLPCAQCPVPGSALEQHSGTGQVCLAGHGARQCPRGQQLGATSRAASSRSTEHHGMREHHR